MCTRNINITSNPPAGDNFEHAHVSVSALPVLDLCSHPTPTSPSHGTITPDSCDLIQALHLNTYPLEMRGCDNHSINGTRCTVEPSCSPTPATERKPLCPPPLRTPPRPCSSSLLPTAASQGRLGLQAPGQLLGKQLQG